MKKTPTQKPKLLFTMPSLRAGGSERVLSSLINYWAAQGTYSLTLVVHDDPANTFYDIHPSVETVYTDLWWKGGKWKIPFQLYRLIKTKSPDLVIGFIYWNAILTLLASLFARVPSIIAERSSPHVVKGFFERRVRNFFYGLARKVIVQTERGSEMFKGSLGHRVSVIANPVPQNQGKASFKKRIISVGRLSKEKEFSVLVEAFSRVEKEYPDWELVIFGEGSERLGLETLVASKGLQKKVKLPGKTQEISRELLESSVFVLTSRFEGMPNALAEAMASGLAVISTDCPTGPRELIDHGKDGLLVPLDDMKALVEALEKCLQDKKFSKTLGKEAKLKMKNYTMEKIAPLWEQAFQGAMEK